jgi:GT2 family glycosyltransferase
MLHKPRVAIVIVNWNKKDYLLNLLNSLKNLDYADFETIVVDNASSDGSSEAIRIQFPDIHTIVNPENLGGTGGFNTGMRYALHKGGYKYIWLLDNDVQVENDALSELIKAMENDEAIGIAGSRIVDIERRDITVEAGAFLAWNTINVEPLFRNKKGLDVQNQIEDVDYVAICSALIKISAVDNVGLMDERFFFFWDDMDWGLQFKKNGYRVVAVLNSIVYHPAFTEKRSSLVDLYYGTRNALLTYAKHTNPLERIPIFFNFMSLRSKTLIFWGLSGRRDLTTMGVNGIWDFIQGKWGGRVFDASPPKIYHRPSALPKEAKKILILNSGYRTEIFAALNQLKHFFPRAEFTLLMYDDRLDIFDDIFPIIIKINSQKAHKLAHNMAVFFRLLFKKYDIAVNSKDPSPFSFAVKKAYDFNYPTREFIESKNDLKGVWKLVLSSVLGELVGLMLLPIIYISSIKHGRA